MQRSPIFHFNLTSDTGIYDVPLKAIIIIHDSGNGVPKVFQKLSQLSLIETSTVQNFLDSGEYNEFSMGFSELQKVFEGANSGWRLLGADPNNYGDIGQDAVDLSFSDQVGNNGAGGSHSFVTGKNNTVQGFTSVATGEGILSTGDHSFSTGKYNVDRLNTILQVGIGTDAANRKNALEVYNDGRVRAPELTIAQQNEPKSLITKEYVDQMTVDGGSF